MSEALHVLALSGSLRQGSFNTALLSGARELAPAGLELTLGSLAEVPLYDADRTEPPAVEALKAAIGDADAVLIATPEYNYSVPGVLKNALDWVSRPAYRSVMAHKPVGVLSASPGPIGGARAQSHLKTVLGSMVAPVFPYPDLCVGSAAERIREGRIVDDKTRELLQRYLSAFAEWVRGQR